MEEAGRKLPYVCPNCRKESVHERAPSSTRYDLAGQRVSNHRIGYIVVCLTCRRRGQEVPSAEHALDSFLRRPRYAGDRVKISTAPTPGEGRIRDLGKWRQGTVRFSPGRPPATVDIQAGVLKRLSESPGCLVLDVEYGEGQWGRVIFEARDASMLQRIRSLLEQGIGCAMAEILRWRLEGPT